MIKNIFEHNEVYKNIFSDDQIKSIYNVIKDDSKIKLETIFDNEEIKKVRKYIDIGLNKSV